MSSSMSGNNRVWTVVCAVATVAGAGRVTASALDQANKAPMHHAVRADLTVDQAQAYIPTDPTRRRATA
ncbi:hypothetical protein SALBM311S_00124 [Streptomyces alboniger]